MKTSVIVNEKQHPMAVGIVRDRAEKEHRSLASACAMIILEWSNHGSTENTENE